jgi:hypothetical protein
MAANLALRLRRLLHNQRPDQYQTQRWGVQAEWPFSLPPGPKRRARDETKGARAPLPGPKLGVLFDESPSPTSYCSALLENSQRLAFKCSTIVLAISNRPSSTTPFRKPGIFTFFSATATSKMSCSSSVKAGRLPPWGLWAAYHALTGFRPA